MVISILNIFFVISDNLTFCFDFSQNFSVKAFLSELLSSSNALNRSI